MQADLESLDGASDHDEFDQLLLFKARHEDHQAKLEQVLRLVANSEVDSPSTLNVACMIALHLLLKVFDNCSDIPRGTSPPRICCMGERIHCRNVGFLPVTGVFSELLSTAGEPCHGNGVLEG